MLRTRIVLLLVPLILIPFLFRGINARDRDIRLAVNPYEEVNWSAEHHKGNFHTHTIESDGSQSPRDVIDTYHEHSYRILSITDHNRVTWPWADYDRDPGRLNMVSVPGNELSRHHHNLSLFSTYPDPIRERSTNDLDTSIEEVRQTDGINVLAHPGRYWNPDDDGVPPETIERYVRLFTFYPSLVGMEVHNQADRYPWDRRLWDALLERMMPDRPVWGFANDDSHRDHHIGLNASWFPISSLDEQKISGARKLVKSSVIDGQFYFSTVTTHPEDKRDMAKAPRIAGVNYDRERNVLSIEAVVGDEPVDADQITWISGGGTEVATGHSLNLGTTDGLTTYLRAEIRSEGALTYTQPFGLTED